MNSTKNNQILNVIHIGKCGGTTVKQSIESSEKINKKYNNIIITHIKKPIYSKDFDYLIIIRNPISRAQSAFNWRKKLVLDKSIKHNFNKNFIENEYRIIKKYNYFNILCEKLFTKEGKLDSDVAQDFISIHHLYHDISYYLEDLLPKIMPKQIYGVIKQYNLNNDCKELLGEVGMKKFNYNHINNIDLESKVHYKTSRSEQLKISSPLYISKRGLSNIKLFLYKDFLCISSLHQLKAISTTEMNELNQFNNRKLSNF